MGPWSSCLHSLSGSVSEQEPPGSFSAPGLPHWKWKLRARTDEVADGGAKLARLSAELEHERSSAEEKVALLERAKTDLADAFKALSAEALKTNQTSFLELAQAALERERSHARDDLDQRRKAMEQLVAPIRESLDKVDGRSTTSRRRGARRTASSAEQVRSLAETQTSSAAETSNLVKALRQPQVRGRWGEIQLRRVVEMAGMLAHCDFVEQESAIRTTGPAPPGPDREAARRQEHRRRREGAAQRLSRAPSRRPTRRRGARGSPTTRGRSASTSRAEQQALLGAVPADAGVRRHVRARRGVLSAPRSSRTRR